MFLDGTVSETHHGIHYISANYPYSSAKTEIFIDLTGITSVNHDILTYSNAQAPATRPMSWNIGYQIGKELDKSNIETAEIDSVIIGNEYFFTDNYSNNAMYWDRGVATIIAETGDIGSGKHDIYELGEIILDVVTMNIY